MTYTRVYATFRTFFRFFSCIRLYMADLLQPLLRRVVGFDGLSLNDHSIGSLLLFGQRIDSRNRLTEFRLTSQLIRAERFGARIADLTRVQGITLTFPK